MPQDIETTEESSDAQQDHKANDVQKDNATHSISEEELVALTAFINAKLEGECVPALSRMRFDS